jgi:hypothetical protein
MSTKRREQSGLLTRIAATESVSLCVRMNKLTAFLEFEFGSFEPFKSSSFVRVKAKRFFRLLLRGKNRRGSNHGLQLFNPISGCLWYPCCLCRL